MYSEHSNRVSPVSQYVGQDAKAVELRGARSGVKEGGFVAR